MASRDAREHSSHGSDRMGVTAERLSENLSAVRATIDAAARRSGRDPREVTLVAVTKTFPLGVLELALGAGLVDLGENRAQELREKAAVLGERPLWHFIGNLQTNKVRSVVGVAKLIHSVDRFGLAEAIGRRAASMGITQDVLLEVNVSGEPTKHGVEMGASLHLANEVAGIDGVRLRGVMTMAPLSVDPESARPHFAELKALSERLRADLPEADLISMGMTHDYAVAVEEGATHVRVGQALFGPRGG
jgi:pyridoxal phosphate enzyme (YggS family)